MTQMSDETVCHECGQDFDRHLVIDFDPGGPAERTTYILCDGHEQLATLPQWDPRATK